MADLVQTANNVIAGSNSEQVKGIAGEAITQGKEVYFNATTKKWMLADSNHVSAEGRIAGGVALNAAATNQPVVVHTSGDINMGATLVLGATYFLSDTPGGTCPDADVGAGENLCQVGIAKSTSILAYRVVNPGVTR